MPNILAYAALIGWPLVAFALFSMFPARVACMAAILGADMFLPAQFSIDLPLIPPFDKDNIAGLSALAACLLVKRSALSRKAAGGKYSWYIVAMIVGLLMTTLTNGSPVRHGPVTLPGQTMHDFVSDFINTLLMWVPPFYLGRKLFCRAEDVKIVLQAFVVAGVIYSIFIFIEVRLSPQLNLWIYGYHQSDFVQTIRFGGYRPKVFMRHGLNVAMFMAISVLACAGLQRARVRTFGLGAAACGAYLSFVLLICKSAGAIGYCIVFVPVLLWLGTKVQARIAWILAALAFSYPLFRTWNLVPVEDMISFFNSILGPDRAQSLEFRFNNEGVLLKHAVEQPWFGWGGYGRNLVYDEYTGKTTTIVDGYWIALLGAIGVMGFVSTFGLLLMPTIRFGKTLRTFHGEHRYLGGTLLVICLICSIDLIPNAGISPYFTLLVGALAGLVREPPTPIEAQTC